MASTSTLGNGRSGRYGSSPSLPIEEVAGAVKDLIREGNTR